MPAHGPTLRIVIAALATFDARPLGASAAHGRRPARHSLAHAPSAGASG
jgi:hypothetical protein